MKNIIGAGLIGGGIGTILWAYGVPSPAFIPLLIGCVLVGLGWGVVSNQESNPE